MTFSLLEVWIFLQTNGSTGAFIYLKILALVLAYPLTGRLSLLNDSFFLTSVRVDIYQKVEQERG